MDKTSANLRARENSFQELSRCALVQLYSHNKISIVVTARYIPPRASSHIGKIVGTSTCTCTCKFKKYLYLTQVFPKVLDPNPDLQLS